MKKTSIRLLALALFLINGCFEASGRNINPELATDITSNKMVYGKKQMIVTNNIFATMAAKSILDQGGNAIDAAIAAGFVLGLVEPQSSGIGGGGYALTYSSPTHKLFAYDAREIAPRAANSDYFITESGALMNFEDAMLSAKSVGVPGEVALFYSLHQKQGKLPWSKLLQSAIDLATNGFPMSPRLRGLLAADYDSGYLNQQQIKSVYFDNDVLKPIGGIVVNQAYAETLKQIAQNPKIFYTGKIANDIISAINTKAGQNLYTKADLKNYSVIRYSGLCGTYRNNYLICSAPPSAAGGTTVLELLKIYSNNYTSLDSSNINSITWMYNFVEASKLAFADRDQYLADPKFVKQPVMGLLSDKYIKTRSKIVSSHALKTPVAAGIPANADKKYIADSNSQEHGTSSLVIVDKEGNAISMTITVEHQFGSHIFVDGFFLNNELTDFAFTAKKKPVANSIQPRKRPRSSIAPIMVFDKFGSLYMLTGSPGGSAIICYVAKNLIQVLDFNMDIATAIASPNFCSANSDLMLETGSEITRYTTDFKKLGEDVVENPLVSGVTSIISTESGWYGAADPRREGVALGD